ncbi:hypothetical protein POM88_049727 [Heracleum sosnowskyi]|uniref:NAC domain-containing protein n=1 Tax=Heracleum sosnowskyi TaxID=360622 RepID=A0AAD8GYY4_9APIA|nr:hypothetical protein POM88_049727 [Heracleum sosnowskyi]
MESNKNLPPGFRFNPFHNELINLYLKPKVLGLNLSCDVVEERKLYGSCANPWQVFDPESHPWILSEVSCGKFEKIAYAFVNLTKKAAAKSNNKSKVGKEQYNRTAGCGTWDGKTKRTEIRDYDGKLIGERKMLVFKIKEVSHQEDLSRVGHWRMHEYSLCGINKEIPNISNTVLCKITLDHSKEPAIELHSDGTTVKVDVKMDVVEQCYETDSVQTCDNDDVEQIYSIYDGCTCADDELVWYNSQFVRGEDGNCETDSVQTCDKDDVEEIHSIDDGCTCADDDLDWYKSLLVSGEDGYMPELGDKQTLEDVTTNLGKRKLDASYVRVIISQHSTLFQLWASSNSYTWILCATLFDTDVAEMFRGLIVEDAPYPLTANLSEFSKLCFGSKLISSNIEETGSHLTAQTNIKHDSDPVNIFELMDCYVHPGPVLSVLLSTNNGAICMCVLCGSFVDEQQTLYMHKTLTQGQSKGCPSLIGHASIVFPVTNDALSREIALNGSILQFTPDGQYLVLLDCIKAPYCRKEKISCPCPECTSLSSKQNAVKIVQVKRGYLSAVATMKTTDTIHCILVCEPNYLIAAEESKRLHIWVMNSSWSEDITESYFPTSDCMDPYVMELKRIPKCPNLVLGHNGFGIFCLWDIAKCILVSRFSAPSISLCRFSPVSLLTLQRQGTVACLDEEHSNIIDASTNLFLENANSHTCSVVGKDVLIPLLILNTDLPSLQSSDRQMNTLGWRQALLVNNEVLSDDILDSRLFSRAILGNLHQFKGSAVSCIATDDLSSGAFAVAADCWLRVYLHS